MLWIFLLSFLLGWGALFAIAWHLDKRDFTLAVPPPPPFRIKPRDALEARETIRKYDPALAMLLDVVMPVEECDHVDWRKVEVRGDTMYDLKRRCDGCGTLGKPSGPRNRWVTMEEYERTRLTADKLRVLNAPEETPDTVDIHVLEQIEPVATMTTVYDPMKDIYQLYTTCKNSEGKTEYYAQTMANQMLKDQVTGLTLTDYRWII